MAIITHEIQTLVNDEEIVIGAYCLLGVEGDASSLILNGPAMIRSHTVLYLGSTIGPNFTTGHHVLIRHGCKIGYNVSIGSSTVIEHTVTIGNNVRIHSQAFIPEFSVIEDDVWIGPRVTCTNAKYPQSIDVKSTLAGPKILAGAIIGANVTLLPGIEIGKKALIGAGSVIARDVPPATVWAGNPARQINTIDKLPYAKEMLGIYS